jgi:rhomboid protease GluP
MNVAIFVLLSLANLLLTRDGLLTTVLSGADIRVLALFGAKVNELIVAGQYWRFLTPVFLHIGLIHLLFNMMALRIFGEQVEALFGGTRFLTLYLLSGLFVSLASFAFSPVPSAGASGAIFGIIGVFTAFLLRNRETFGTVAEQQLRSMVGLIVVNLLLGATVPGIDNWGHMGGLVSGLAMGLAMAPTYRFQQAWPGPPTAVERRPLFPPLLTSLAGLLLFGVGVMLALPLAP